MIGTYVLGVVTGIFAPKIFMYLWGLKGTSNEQHIRLGSRERRQWLIQNDRS